MATLEKDTKQPPVYLPFKTLETAIVTLEQGFPDKLDKSVWGSLSGGVQSQVVSAFRFLKLIDAENNVQPVLKTLVKAKGEERYRILREVLEVAYPDIVTLAGNNASLQTLNDTMRTKGIKGATLVRGIRFYLHAAKIVGLPLSPYWDTGGKPANVGTKTRRRGKAQRPQSSGSEQMSPKKKGEPDGATQTIKLRSGGHLALNIEANLFTLSQEDRTFIFGLIDQLMDYEKKKVAQN
ncbi:MAG: hypothetical protein HY664_01075 [Chloroflexi bacterium]|nr:hypothetical protein [Chloroflexota bacterium]